MSCNDSKDTTTALFEAESYHGSAALIQLLEQTQSSGNVATLLGVRGKIRLDLTAYSGGTATVYFKVDTQDDGVSNDPPVEADGLYHSALSATVGIVNTSDYYADVTPSFNVSNNCTLPVIKMGWILTDQLAIVNPSFTHNV